MSLQFEQQTRKQTDNKLKSVNLDISILKGLAKPSTISTDTDVKPKPSKLSLHDLSSILVNKNKKFQEMKEQKKQAIQWLKYKGVDWRKLNLQVKQNTILAEEQAVVIRPKVTEKRDLQQVLSIKGKLGIQPQKQRILTKQMQDEFISKQKQVILCKVVMNSLRKTKQKNNTRSALINKLRGESGIDSYEFNLQRQLQADQQRVFTIDRKNVDVLRNEYFDFVKTLSADGFDTSLHLLKKVRPFWKIVLEHIKTIQHYAPQLLREGLSNEQDSESYPLNTVSHFNLRMNQYIMIKSLKIIEKEFEKTLPQTSSFEKLNEIVREMERRNRKLKIWRNSNGEATWAMAFLLLKAGRINDVKRVLESVDRDILASLVLQNESINMHKPQKSLKSYDVHKYNDTFYGQIIRILEATPKFDPLVLMNEPLNKVWLLLRTTGIYRSVEEVNQQFDRVNEQLINAECQTDEPIDELKVQQFLYMGNYNHFIYLCEMLLENKLPHKANQYLTYHDYFHLLTVINYFPELWGDSKGGELNRLQGKFAESLVHYMRRLRTQKYKIQLPSYLLLSPNDKIQEVACKFITNVEEYKEFDWRSLKQLMKVRDSNNGSKLFKFLQKQVLDSLSLNKFNDFLFAAQSYHIDFPQYEDSLYHQQKCYVKLLLAYLYFAEKKKQLIRANQSTQQFDREMFSFFSMSPQKTNQNDLTRRQTEIKRKVQDCEQKLQVDLIRNSNDEEYIANITVPFAFYKKFNELSRLMQNPVQRIAELKNFKPKWTQALNESQKHQFLQGLQPVLLRFLGFQFNQSNYSALYVYYLTELIERKKILCSIDCDYTGVMNEIRLIAGYLRHLQGHYKKKTEELKKRVTKIEGQQKRIFTQQSTNPLNRCPQYQALKLTIRDVIGEQIGTVALHSFTEPRMTNAEERRRTAKERYTANEYFREEIGY